MNYFDVNVWGIFTMPLGVLLCFGPIILAWIATCRENPTPKEEEDRYHPGARTTRH